MIKLDKKDGKYWKVKDFSTIASWQYKKQMPAIYRKYAIRICTWCGTAWGINNGHTVFGIEILEWVDIPRCYREDYNGKN